MGNIYIYINWLWLRFDRFRLKYKIDYVSIDSDSSEAFTHMHLFRPRLFLQNITESAPHGDDAHGNEQRDQKTTMLENDRVVTTIARDPNNARNGVTCRMLHLYRALKSYFQTLQNICRKDIKKNLPQKIYTYNLHNKMEHIKNWFDERAGSYIILQFFFFRTVFLSSFSPLRFKMHNHRTHDCTFMQQAVNISPLIANNFSYSSHVESAKSLIQMANPLKLERVCTRLP